jgi:hypothetical protein
LSGRLESLTEEGFFSLCFYDFIEFLYLAAQYHNPDPFVNPNQKFANFIEKTVLVNVQFKVKSLMVKRFSLNEGNQSHREGLIKAIQHQKILRGVAL